MLNCAASCKACAGNTSGALLIFLDWASTNGIVKGMSRASVAPRLGRKEIGPSALESDWGPPTFRDLAAVGSGSDVHRSMGLGTLAGDPFG